MIPDIYETILFHARSNPHAIAVRFGEKDISYASFAAHIEQVSRRLNASGLAPGSRVGVRISHSYLHWLVLLALKRLDVVSTSIAPSADAQALDWLRIAHVVSDEAMDYNPPCIRANLEWLAKAPEDLPPVGALPDPGRICHMMISSGTAGKSKKVLLSRELLYTRLRNLTLFYNISKETCTLAAIGIGTVAGFQVPLATWIAGGTVAIADTMQHLYRTLIDRNVNFLFTAPGNLRLLLRQLPPSAQPLPSLRILTSGGPLPKSVSLEARTKLTALLYVAYGSTEASVVGHAHASAGDTMSGTAVQVVPCAQVEIINSEGKPASFGELGEIRIRSEGLVSEYADETQGNNAFRNGWFHPGDSGSLSPHGLLTIMGRTDELIDIGDGKIPPALIEDAALVQPYVKDAGAFMLQSANGASEVLLVVTLSDAEKFDKRKIDTELHRRFPNLSNARVAVVDTIPRNANGKILRRALLDKFRNVSATGSGTGLQQ